MKVNIGKGFRSPLPQELAADGVNYHYYRYEKGNQELDPEVSYQLDLGLEWNYKGVALEVSPFAGYFPNYIYLNPTSDYFEGMQVFQYRESRVFRAGGEIHAHFRLVRQLKAGFVAEYVYSRQLSGDKKEFTIPFTPPASFIISLNYTPKFHHVVIDPFFTLDYHLVLEQNRIVPPELTTPGYQVFNLSAGFELLWGKFNPEIGIRMQNLLNRKYLDHLSYYRLIGAPEPGRNFVLSITIPFGLSHHQAGPIKDDDN
jgi:iron complex outermembrane receptor protein